MNSFEAKITGSIEYVRIAFLENLGHGIIVGTETEVFSILYEVWQLVGDVSRHLVASVTVVHGKVSGLFPVIEDGVVIVLLGHPPALHR